MANKQSDGAAIRAALDGPDIDHDTLIETAERFNRQDGERASSAGETRQAIGEFLEETNLNGKSFAWLRSIMKKADKDRAKALDMVRGLEVGLPMVKLHIAGNQSDWVDNTRFDDDEVPEPVEPRAPSYEPDPDFDEVAPLSDEMQAETDDFDAHLARAAE